MEPQENQNFKNQYTNCKFNACLQKHNVPNYNTSALSLAAGKVFARKSHRRAGTDNGGLVRMQFQAQPPDSATGKFQGLFRPGPATVKKEKGIEKTRLFLPGKLFARIQAVIQCDNFEMGNSWQPDVIGYRNGLRRHVLLWLSGWHQGCGVCTVT